MKTEQQILEKLEQLVTEVEQLAASIPPEQLDSNTMPLEQQRQVNFLVGGLLLLAWMLDCEDEIKPVVRAIRMQQLADKLEGE